MAFERITTRQLPDGFVSKVYPFHISLEGMESVVLCRTPDDYDTMIKYFHVCTWVNNVLVIIDVAMSNHGHLAVLAMDLDSARRAGESIKKNYSQYFTWKYGERRTLLRADVNVQYLDSDWYLRNTLAYIPRNALDAGSSVEEYPWSSYRAMFQKNGKFREGRKVALLSRRDKESLFHTHADLKDVPWRVDRSGRLDPASACDIAYLEDAFNHDQAFFLKTIGTVNCAEMHQKLVSGPRQRQKDDEFYLTVMEIADRWFHKSPAELSLEMKTRLLPYLWRCYRTSPHQLARCLRLDLRQVEEILLHNTFPR